MKAYEDHKEVVDRFIQEYGREPTSFDFMTCSYLPTPRTIQRRYGGLPAFRKRLGLKTLDFTKGAARRDIAIPLNQNNCVSEAKIYHRLLEQYTHRHVAMPVRPYRGSIHTLDLKIEKDGTIFLVDIFHPKDRYAFASCVRHKNRKYADREVDNFPGERTKVILVCTNEEAMRKVRSRLPIWSISKFSKFFEI